MLDNLVVLDIETTGLDANRDQIIEFGALHIKEGEIQDRLEFFIRPSTSFIPEIVTKLTGITFQDLEHAKPLEEYRETIINFIGDRTIVGHNPFFDLQFLEQHLGVKFTNERWDTVGLAKVFFPQAYKYALEPLIKYLNIEVDSDFQCHRAGYDAWASWKVLEKCWTKGLDYDLSFYMQTRHIFSQLLCHRFFDRLEKEIIKTYPQRPIKTGIILSGRGDDLFSRVDYSREIPDEQAWVSSCFDKQGLLEQNLAEFESRLGQKQMAELVLDALSQSKRTVIEAGTGIGKSFAYLIPSIWWARKARRKVVVATHTIPLQEQLDKRDLPVLKETLPFSFRTAILKGRGNYLCLRNWLNLQKNTQELSVEEKLTALAIHVWLRETIYGDLQELPLLTNRQNLWYLLNGENDCLPQKCAHASSCFLLRAREQAEAADIIVVNHSLLLADVKTDFSILPNYQDLIIDEAHHLYQSALTHLGWEVGLGQIVRLIDTLTLNKVNSFYHTVKRRAHLLGESLGQANRFLEELEQLPKHGEALIEQARLLFELLEQLMDSKLTFRIKPTDGASIWWTELRLVFENLYLRFNDLLQLIKSMYSILSAEESDEYDSVRMDLQAYRRQIEEMINGLYHCYQIEDSKYVRWLEYIRGNVVLKTAPVEVSSILHDQLFAKLKSVVLTSATLSVAGGFSHFLQDVGLPKETETISINSPFDYDQQMRLLVVEGLNPYDVEQEYSEQVAEFIGEVSRTINGRILVLFTSHNTLREVYYKMQLDDFSGITICAQGIEGSRGSVLDDFIKSPRAVLLGANSFWEGIDLPGELLSCVIMVKLPFSPPSLPLVEARSELLKSTGKNPFQELLLPEAIIKFKQGFGRLIRRKSDRGLIILLDSRVLEKSYGKSVFASLPLKSYYRGSKGYVLRKIEEWSNQTLA